MVDIFNENNIANFIKMRYKHIIFDIDGTMLDSAYADITALQRVIHELQGKKYEPHELHFALGIPGEVTLAQLGIKNVVKANLLWNDYMKEAAHTMRIFDGIRELIIELKGKGVQLGIITSKNKNEYHNDFTPFGLDSFFNTIITVEDSAAPKPSAEPMLAYLKNTGADRQEVLYIGDTLYDRDCAEKAGVDFGLAMWGCHSIKHIYATYYFANPKDVLYILSQTKDAYKNMPWLKWAMELQFIGQGGLTYSENCFDRERFERIRELSAEIMSLKSGLSPDIVRGLFCNETGFQTPKLDTRAAIFESGKILLVKERDERWSLPGGWVDVNQSIKSNTVKEVKEESGLDVVAVKLIALQDRNKHNLPPYPYGVCKAFVQCQIIGGEFKPNIETTDAAFFSPEELPTLAEEKNNKAQISLCFEAYNSDSWDCLFD